jgi:hypothetical protein
VADKDLFARVYPTLKPFAAKETGSLYWRGSIPLIDATEVQVVIAEVGENPDQPYAVAVKGGTKEMAAVCQAVGEKRFASAREAMILVERTLNHALFAGRSKGPKRSRRFWGAV